MRLLIGLAIACSAYAEKPVEMVVKIIGRKDSSSTVTTVIPAKSRSTVSGNAACAGSVAGAICSGGVTSETTSTPAQTISSEISGAALALLLPDGRVAVVACESKYGFGRPNGLRDCRIPPADTVRVEFSADNAKLKWPVSIDGKKLQSETYKIISVSGPPAPK